VLNGKVARLGDQPGIPSNLYLHEAPGLDWPK